MEADSLAAVSSKCRGNADLCPAGCRELDQLPSVCWIWNTHQQGLDSLYHCTVYLLMAIHGKYLLSVRMCWCAHQEPKLVTWPDSFIYLPTRWQLWGYLSYFFLPGLSTAQTFLLLPSLWYNTEMRCNYKNTVTSTKLMLLIAMPFILTGLGNMRWYMLWDHHLYHCQVIGCYKSVSRTWDALVLFCPFTSKSKPLQSIIVLNNFK